MPETRRVTDSVPPDTNAIVGTHDILWVTLDTLRHDVACESLVTGRTPHLARLLGSPGWDRRHTPASFTYAAHLAFFAGFLPTPATPGHHPRRFAVRFEGSASTDVHTCVFDAPDIVRGLSRHGYHTLCVGGTGFFDPSTPLGRTLTGSFDEVCFEPEFRVTERDGLAAQITRLGARIADLDPNRRVFAFVNVSSLHQPNRVYLPGAATDSRESHAAALAYVDTQVPALLTAIRRTRPVLVMLFSDHGTAYGEDGYVGHRVGHDTVWTVPYAERVLPPRES